MTEETDPPHLESDRLHAEVRAAREALVELARSLPESRAYRATPRPGWTLKHELAALGAADRELTHVLDEVRRRSGPVVIELRRRRAQAMHELQQLRLRPLLEHLEVSGAALADTLAAHQHELARAVHIERPTEGSQPTSVAELARAYQARAQRALETLRHAIEG